MGYRLYATIPNVDYENNYLELGKQYEEALVDVNDKWGFSDNDERLFETQYMSEGESLRDFVNELKEVNEELVENNAEHYLYNLDLLDKLVEFAIENKYTIWFYSR